MSYKAEGKIIHIGKEETFGANGFRKRLLVVMTEDQYPQTIPFEFTQDKCDLLNSFKLNAIVEINFNIKGREWTNPEGEVKYFMNLQGWRIVLKGENPVAEQEPVNDKPPF